MEHEGWYLIKPGQSGSYRQAICVVLLPFQLHLNCLLTLKGLFQFDGLIYGGRCVILKRKRVQAMNINYSVVFFARSVIIGVEFKRILPATWFAHKNWSV